MTLAFQLHHENKNLEEAIKVLQAAFSQYPEHFNNQGGYFQLQMKPQHASDNGYNYLE